MAAQGAAQQAVQAAHQLVDVEHLGFQGLAAGKGQQALGEVGAPLGGVRHHGGKPPEAGIRG